MVTLGFVAVGIVRGLVSKTGRLDSLFHSGHRIVSVAIVAVGGSVVHASI